MERIDKDTYYLNIAREVAKRSICLRKHYGAVIVNNDAIVSTGYNNPPRKEPHCTVCTKIKSNKDELEFEHCPAVHAEQNALLECARKDAIGGTLYLAGWIAHDGDPATTEDEENMNVYPCEICLRLIKNAGIERVVTNKGIIYTRDENGVLIRVGV